MFKILTAASVNKQVLLSIPREGRRCFIIIDNQQKIEMIPEQVKGAASGIRWYFKCSETGVKCRRLTWLDNRYVHRSMIKNFYRKNKPAWYSESSLNPILVKKQRQIDAEKMIARKWFKRSYRGKPTKAYQKCLRDIEVGSSYSMFGIINGYY